MTSKLKVLSNPFLKILEYLGDIFFLTSETLGGIFQKPRRISLIIQQIAEIGFRSQAVICITGGFTGAVLTAQALFQFEKLNMETLGGALTSVAMLRELGPVITSLMLAGRTGASMAAHIGTMKISEQLDALKCMNVNPTTYLVSPRTVAMIISCPLLVMESALIGIITSYFIGIHLFEIPVGYWIYHMQTFTSSSDIIIAVIKGIIFGFLIVIISCDQGFRAKNGAVGVGKKTTQAVVFSSIAILISNFFLTFVINIFFPVGK